MTLLGTAISKQGVEIRLTAERWQHIRVRHGHVVPYKDKLLPTVAEPELVLERLPGEFKAAAKVSADRWLVVVYIIRGGNGFIATAYPTSGELTAGGWKQVWP